MIDLDSNEERQQQEKLLSELRDISNRYNKKRLKTYKRPALVYELDTSSDPTSTISQGNNAKHFLQKYDEDENLNQYWYSIETISILCNVILEAIHSMSNKRVAFLSTPSLYFAMPKECRTQSCMLFDFDEKWGNDSGYVFYDYNHPTMFLNKDGSKCSNLEASFDMVVIDPPFITYQVWQKYAETARYLLRNKQGLILATTVGENHSFLNEMLSLEPINSFQPVIPNLVYQYTVFTNFDSVLLNASTS